MTSVQARIAAFKQKNSGPIRNEQRSSNVTSRQNTQSQKDAYQRAVARAVTKQAARDVASAHKPRGWKPVPCTTSTVRIRAYQRHSLKDGVPTIRPVQSHCRHKPL